MSTTNGGPADPAAAANVQPQLSVVAQYIKDLSFENPNAPRSLMASGVQPQINIQINVGVQKIDGDDFEVALKLEGKAETGGQLMFGFELVFGGVFRVSNVPQESLNPILLIECPRLLFPFAREIVASTVRHGGFPPLLLDPIDFAALYRQRLAEQAGSQPAPQA